MFLWKFSHRRSTYTLIKKLKYFHVQHIFAMQCHIQLFFGHTIYLTLKVGWFSDTQKSPMAVAEFPRLFDVQCIRGRILCLLKMFFFSICRLYFIQELQVLQELFWASFLRCPTRSNGTKIHLDAALLWAIKENI